MADNVIYQTTAPATPPNGLTVAADDVGGVAFQVVKLDVGGDGVSAPVSAANPVPVSGPLTNAQLRAASVPVSDADMFETMSSVYAILNDFMAGKIATALQTGQTDMAHSMPVVLPTDQDVNAIADLTAAVHNIIDHMERPIYVDRTNASLRANVGTVTTVSAVTPLTAPATTDPLFLMFINSFRTRFSSAFGDKIS